MGWPTRKLGEICEERKEKNVNNLDLPVFTVSHIHGLVPYQRVFYKQVHSEDVRNYKVVRRYDFAFGLPTKNTLPYGLLESEENVLVSPSYVVFTIKSGDVLFPRFLYYLFKTDLYKWKIIEAAKSQSGTRHGLPLKFHHLADLEIPLPPLPIQQKIVKILDTVQEAVEVQDKIIEKTKELKKSLMADLFKYGGPSFKKGRKLKKTEIGEIPENWEVVRLGEVVNDLTNGFPAGERDEMGILQLRMDSITSDGKINLNAGVKIPKKKGLEIYLLQKGDILFNNTNSIDLVGKTALYKGEFKECVFSNHITRIRVNPHRTLPEWIFYILFRYWELKLFKNLAVRRVGQADISRNTLKNINIPLPPLPEQQEISEILQTVDQKIEIEQKKKELYEELFKTLLNKIMNQEIDVENIRLEG